MYKPRRKFHPLLTCLLVVVLLMALLIACWSITLSGLGTLNSHSQVLTVTAQVARLSPFG